MSTHDSQGLSRPSTRVVVTVALLLAAPVVALMWVSSYAKDGPRLLGFPFFYWYQFLWVFIAAACTSVAFRLISKAERRRPGQGEDR